MLNEEVGNKEQLIKACKELRKLMSLNESQLEFMSHLCYAKRGMWVGDTHELIRNEAKRELFLFLETIKECTAEETAEHFLRNGEEEWIISLMNLLTQKQ